MKSLQTDIWLVVRVPVLSEQMTEVQPRVSTDGKLRTMAFFFAIRRVPADDSFILIPVVVYWTELISLNLKCLCTLGGKMHETTLFSAIMTDACPPVIYHVVWQMWQEFKLQVLVLPY